MFAMMNIFYADIFLKERDRSKIGDVKMVWVCCKRKGSEQQFSHIYAFFKPQAVKCIRGPGYVVHDANQAERTLEKGGER